MKFDVKGVANKVGSGATKAAGKAQDTALFVAGKGKDGAIAVKNQCGNAKYDLDKKILKPVFKEDIDDITYYHPPLLLRIIEFDKKRDGNSACEGAVGFRDNIKGSSVLHIYSKYADELGLIFYPGIQDTLYCPNPYNPQMFISIDEYFNYLKKAKVDELEQIACSLGAKYIKISFKERKTKFISNDGESTGNLGKKRFTNPGDSNVDFETSSNTEIYSDIKVASESVFDGDTVPVKPSPRYYENESDIKALINMRLNATSMNNIKSKTYTFECCNKREMNLVTAGKIDAVIKKLKLQGNGTVKSQVEEEQRTILEYQIQF